MINIRGVGGIVFIIINDAITIYYTHHTSPKIPRMNNVSMYGYKYLKQPLNRPKQANKPLKSIAKLQHVSPTVNVLKLQYLLCV